MEVTRLEGVQRDLRATDGLTIPPAAFDARLDLSRRGGDAAATTGMAA